MCCTRHLLVCRGNFFFQSLPLVLAVPVEENKIARKLCLKLGYALERLGLLESVFFIWPEQQNNYDRFLYVSNTELCCGAEVVIFGWTCYERTATASFITVLRYRYSSLNKIGPLLKERT